MAASNNIPENYLLGIDSGVGSIGWGALTLDEHDQPYSVLAAGARGFRSGIPDMREYRKGTEELSNAKRRISRSQRRQARRRSSRHAAVYGILQAAGFLPEPASKSRWDRHLRLQALDKELAAQFPGIGKHESAHRLPYHLRAIALTQPLSAPALGRAIYHLAQRRGFRGSLKAGADGNDEKKGEVETKISELESEMNAAAVKTLGAYFTSDHFLRQGSRIRDRWTRRAMYKNEFTEIWNSQQPHHPAMTPSLRKQLERAMFFQRPTRAPRVGKCGLERGSRRAPIACLEFQEFRWRQMLNNLRVIHPARENPELTTKEYTILAEKLEITGELRFPEVRTLLDLNKKPHGFRAGYKFNFELDDDDELIGNRTASRLHEAIGECWHAISPANRQRLVEEILSFDSEEALARRLQRNDGFAFDPETAARIAKVRLERGSASFSRKAIRKLLPHLRNRKTLPEAKQEAGYGRNVGGRIYEELPPVRVWNPDINNPVVLRTLSQLRTIVNRCISEYGKPTMIRLELARDLKHSRKRREKMTQRNRADRNERTRIIKQILEKIPGFKGGEPSRDDILKVRLANECGWVCPYTGGDSICMRTLLMVGEFQIEHIFPRRRCGGEDSFANKTLCRVTANADKSDRTPFEAFGPHKDSKRWHEIIARVKRFGGRYKGEKLRRFLTEHVPQDFIDRQLNDTAYASRLAGDYLGLLYGGQVDASGRRVQVSPGRATLQLREAWQLDGILHNPTLRDFVRSENSDRKNRYDHRHHAVDAIVIALTDAGKVATLGEAAQRAEERGTRLRAEMKQLPKQLRDGIPAAVASINVSWKRNRRLRGMLHKENALRQPIDGGTEKALAATTRIALNSIVSEKQVDRIVDPRTRELVRTKFLQHKPESTKSPFENKENHPYFETRHGRVFVHRVTVNSEKATTIIPVGKGSRRRWVDPAVANHHMDVWAVLDSKGNEKLWVAETLSVMEAASRLRERKRDGTSMSGREQAGWVPKWLTDKYGAQGKFRFKFSFASDEYIVLDDGKGRDRLVRIVGISHEKVEFRLHTDGRPSKLMRDKIKGGRAGLSKLIDSLRRAKARKVVVDPLGNILPAND